MITDGRMTDTLFCYPQTYPRIAKIEAGIFSDYIRVRVFASGDIKDGIFMTPSQQRLRQLVVDHIALFVRRDADGEWTETDTRITVAFN